MKEAVLILDMANDFVYGKLKTDRAQRIIVPIQDLSREARLVERPVVYINDAHMPTDPEIDVWGEHSMKGTEAAETIPEIAPLEGDYVLEKRTYSAFHETGLDMLLRRLGVDSVVITGLHTNICARHTSADAFHRGYKVTVPGNCVQALSDEDHESGLEYLKSIYGARITTSDELIDEWRKEAEKDWDLLEEEIEAVHHGEVPEFRPIDMELLWRCLKCGHLIPKNGDAPEKCPKCGAPGTEFEAVIED